MKHFIVFLSKSKVYQPVCTKSSTVIMILNRRHTYRGRYNLMTTDQQNNITHRTIRWLPSNLTHMFET